MENSWFLGVPIFKCIRELSSFFIHLQTSLKSQLIEKKSELQAYVSDCEILKGKLISRDEELDDIKCQFTSVNNALEVSFILFTEL